jgi:hypothetical protein
VPPGVHLLLPMVGLLRPMMINCSSFRTHTNPGDVWTLTQFCKELDFDRLATGFRSSKRKLEVLR